jgi:hypothetical protein
MRKLLRTAYRLLFRNRIIRWTWLLALVLYGVKIGTDRGFAWHRTPSAKTILTISPTNIESFTIQNAEAEHLTFSRQDTVWLVVKNNITVRLPEDSVRPYLTLFSKLERLAVKTLKTNEAETNEAGESPKWLISLVEKKGVKHSLSINYTALDSLTNENLTFVKIGNERLLNGVRGDWETVLSKNFDDFRDHRLFDFPVKNATDIAFVSPSDTLIFYRKDAKDPDWRNRNKLSIEPIVFQNFIENLDILRGPVFYDDDRDLLADRKISNRLFVRTATDTAIIKAYKLDNFYVIHSSRNPENYFKIDSTAAIFFK